MQYKAVTTTLFLSVLMTHFDADAQSAAQAFSPVMAAAERSHIVPQWSNNIMVVYEDSKGRYWLGSWQDGLYTFDGKQILRYTSSDGLPDNRVEEIKEDKHGNLYINTTKGIFLFNGIGFTPIPEVNDNSWRLHPDDLWFRCPGQPGYIRRLEGNRLHRLTLPPNAMGERYRQSHPGTANPYLVYCIYKDRHQNIWIGTATLGACRYNGRSCEWISETDLTELHEGPANGVRSIAEDSNGDFWFNTAYKYHVYSKQATKAFYTRVASIGSLDGKAGGDLNEFLSIIRDRQNNLWIATYNKGVWKYDGRHTTHYPVRDHQEPATAYCLYEDRKGTIWLGTHTHGLFRFVDGSFQRFRP